MRFFEELGLGRPSPQDEVQWASGQPLASRAFCCHLVPLPSLCLPDEGPQVPGSLMSWGSRPRVLELIIWVCILVFSHVHFAPHSYLFSVIIPLSLDCFGVLIPLPLISMVGPLTCFLGMVWSDFLSFQGSVCVCAFVFRNA